MDDFEAIRRRATDENNNWPGWAQTDRRMLFTHIAALEARVREQQSENERLARISLAARALLKYIDDHDWGHIPEGVTADTLRDLLTASETPT